MLAKKFVLVKPFEGLPKLTDFQIVEETLPAELQNGGTVIYILYYNEAYNTKFPL